MKNSSRSPTASRAVTPSKARAPKKRTETAAASIAHRPQTPIAHSATASIIPELGITPKRAWALHRLLSNGRRGRAPITLEMLRRHCRVVHESLDLVVGVVVEAIEVNGGELAVRLDVLAARMVRDDEATSPFPSVEHIGWFPSSDSPFEDAVDYASDDWVDVHGAGHGTDDAQEMAS